MKGAIGLVAFALFIASIVNVAVQVMR